MWGGNNGFQNALAMGMQMGAQARQAKEARDERNALAAYVKSPNEQTFAGLADVRPDIAIGERQQMQAQQQEAMVADLSNRYLGGDAAAGDELARINFDRWSKIDGAVKAKAKQDADLFGGAALDVLQVPPGEQRRARIITYAQQFPQLADQINEIAFLPPQEQETRLRAVVAQAGLIQKLHDMERPSYQAIPEGGTLVNTRDPAAVQQFQQGTGQGVAIPPLPDIEAELRRRGVL